MKAGTSRPPSSQNFQESIKHTPHDRSYAFNKINSNETQLGPPKGIVPGLTPAATEGEGWTWSKTNDESEEDDESLRLSRAHLRASILTSLPSTATATQDKLPETSMTSSNSISLLFSVLSFVIFNSKKKKFCDSTLGRFNGFHVSHHHYFKFAANKRVYLSFQIYIM